MATIDIVITDGHHFHPSVRNGAAYTSVACNAYKYGSSSPCTSKEEIAATIKRCKATIAIHKDKWRIVDKRDCAKLSHWFS